VTKKTSVSYINVPRPAGARSPALHEHIGCVVVHANVHVHVRVLACGLTYTHTLKYMRARARCRAVCALLSRHVDAASIDVWHRRFPLPRSDVVPGGVSVYVGVRRAPERKSIGGLLNLPNAPRDSISTNPASRPSISSARFCRLRGVHTGISRGINIETDSLTTAPSVSCLSSLCSSAILNLEEPRAVPVPTISNDRNSRWLDAPLRRPTKLASAL